MASRANCSPISASPGQLDHSRFAPMGWQQPDELDTTLSISDRQMVCGSGNQIAKMRTERKKTTSRKAADGLAYLCCVVGSCLILFPTFLRSSENTMSGVRSRNPISRRQLVPHLQWNRPMNCCFILRPQFGQIRLLAPIAPPFHIDFVFLIVFNVFRDSID